MLENVIEDLTKALEIETPQKTEKGEYIFTFDETINVRIFSIRKDRLTIVTEVSNPLPDSDETEKLLKKALQWNFTRLKEYEETLTWEPESNQMLLVKETPLSELSEKPLMRQLEQFLNNVDYWKSVLSPREEFPIPKFPL